MSTLADIRAGLAANLSTLLGVQVSAYVLANPTLPVIWIRPSSASGTDYHRAMQDGAEDWNMLVQAYVGTVSDIAAQKKLDEFLASKGATSVKAALESDRTLGGAAEDLIVQSCSGYLEYARPDGSTALGAEWQVLVRTAGG